MPKDVSERIIDTPYSLPTPRSGATTIGGGGGGGAPTNLDALTDVTLSAPVNLQVLTYNSATGQWVNGASTAMTAHALSGPYHTGQLHWNLIDFSGSSIADLAAHSHSLLTGIGVNDHHPHQHPLVGTDALGVAQHTATGLTTGNVVRATGATTFAWQQLQHTDLGNVLPDQHHTRAHDIISGDGSGPVHSVVGADFTVVGVHPVNTLALLPTSSAPGAAVSILKTDANGGIQLDTNLLYVDGANNWVGFNRTPSGATLDVIASANADHTQRIKQKSGQTGRMWRIEDLSGNELIVLDSVGNLQSGRPGFVSGLTGWQITPQGNAEFNNIWARGELHATVFVKDEVHATGGTLLVATAGTLHDDAVIDSSVVDDDVLIIYSTPAGAGVPLQVVTTSGTFTGNELHVSHLGNYINVNDPPSGPGFYFQPGDVVRSKTEVPTGVTDFWLEINSATQNSGYATYSVFKRSGTDGTLPKGSAIVSYGKQGDGRILLTSDLNYAPYIDVFTVGPNVWTGAAGSVVPRMRMGRLDGIGLPGVSGVEQYGMIAGKDLSDANSGYLIASNLQFSLYKVDIRLNNGTSDTGLWTADGNLKIGKNVGAAATTGFQFDPSTGDVIIGDQTKNNYLRWNHGSGTLVVSGNLLVTDPGGTVTLADVNALDNIVRTDAQGYATTAQNTATAYSDVRRIVGVNGSWDSPTSTTIRWGTKAAGGAALSAAFATGSARTIADHAGASVTISTRTYLYVSVSGTGTMTMLTTTSIGTVIGVNNVLIAVCDPGDSTTKACSITIVAGSTFISGSNIFTGSIVAANIAAGTITANKLDAATLTSTYLDPVTSAAASDATTKANTAQTNAAADATTKANNAQSAAITAAAADATAKANAAGATAQAYGNQYKLQAIRGGMTVQAMPGGRNGITWTGITLFYADGTTFAIPNGSLSGLSTTARSYVHYVYGTAVFVATTNLSGLSTTASLIAVFDPGVTPSDPGSLSIVGGATYISGNNIVTGSILAANIKTAAITADKMNVTDLNALTAGVGNMTITDELIIGNATGKIGTIHSVGKASYSNTTSGIFLGWDGAGVPGYKFAVGDASNYINWGGAGLPFNISSAGGVNIVSGASSPYTVMSLVRGGGGGGVVNLIHEDDPSVAAGGFGRTARIRVDNPFKFDFEVYANKFVQLGDTMQLKLPRTLGGPTATGIKGEICWDDNYLYVCVNTNLWRRIPLLDSGTHW